MISISLNSFCINKHFSHFLLNDTEICDFIRTENIKSLIEYIVTKYMRHSSAQHSPSSSESTIVKLPPCIEDLATPYVDTLTLLRRQYEENIRVMTARSNGGDHGKRSSMSEKALEDQRKFREADDEESYFFDDVDDKNDPMISNSDGHHSSMSTKGYTV